MKVINFLKNNKYFLLGLVVLSWVIFVNLFPEDFIISSTDTSQIINARENFWYMFLDFPNTFWYYGLIYLLDIFQISFTRQLSFTMGIFIFGSYISFYIFSKLLFKTSDFSRSTFSLIYALNVFSLYTLTMHGLGYTSFFYLYIFIPILVGFFIKFLITQKRIFLLFFCLVLFLVSPGFNNPAFALALAIVLFLVVILLIAMKKTEFSQRLFLNVALVIALSFLISTFWVIPTLPLVKSGVESLSTTSPTNLVSALIDGGNPVFDTLGLNNYSHDYFPYNFPYNNLIWLKGIFIFLTYLPILLLLFAVILVRKMENKELFFVSLSILLFLILGVGKMIHPFESINYFIFVKIWGFNTLRAYDKLAIFLPFFLLFPIFIFFIKLEKTKYRKLGIILTLLILVTPLPFYLGKLQQNMSIRFAGLSPEKKDFRTARLTFLVKIPEDYYKIKNLIDQKDKYFIATLPNNLGWTGTGSSNYPKWKLNGADVTQRILGKKFIEANSPYFNDWIFAAEFSDRVSKENDWIIKLLGMMNAKYIIFHKDAPNEAVQKTIGKMRSLEEGGTIKNLEENDYFILYEINKDYFLPYFSWQAENFPIQSNADSVGRNFAKIKENSAEIKFQEINPKKFVIDLKNQELGKNLILAENFNPLWKAYYVLDSGEEIEIGAKNHFVARGYANGWKIVLPENTAQIVIEYYPIRLMWRGMWISGITILFLIIYLLKYYYVRRKLAKN